MLISRTAEYALRAVVCLAQQPENTRGTGQIAEVSRVPPGYLSKVLQTLARADLVASSPGRGGGFRLVRPAAEVTVLEVIDAVDPIQRIETCPLGLAGHGTELCALHRRLDEAAEAVRAAFAGVTVADLLHEGTSSTPLCEA